MTSDVERHIKTPSQNSILTKNDFSILIYEVSILFKELTK